MDTTGIPIAFSSTSGSTLIPSFSATSIDVVGDEDDGEGEAPPPGRGCVRVSRRYDRDDEIRMLGQDVVPRDELFLGIGRERSRCPAGL